MEHLPCGVADCIPSMLLPPYGQLSSIQRPNTSMWPDNLSARPHQNLTTDLIFLFVIPFVQLRYPMGRLSFKRARSAPPQSVKSSKRTACSVPLAKIVPCTNSPTSARRQQTPDMASRWWSPCAHNYARSCRQGRHKRTMTQWTSSGSPPKPEKGKLTHQH